MTVALMIIAHGNLGTSMLRQAEANLGALNLPVGLLEVAPDDSVEQLEEAARKIMEEIDEGSGIVLLTDVFGATPSNIAHRCCGPDCSIVHGLNLAMLLRAQCYSELPREALAQKLVWGGRDAVFVGDAPPLEDRSGH